MARAFGKILSRTWDDGDFLALEVSPQRLYHFLVSQSNLSHAGLLPLTLKKWSKKARNLTVADLERDLAVLNATRFVVLDEDTEELLIRTYVRNDDIWKMPRMMGAMVSCAPEIESHRLRRALLTEIGRIPVHELSDEPTKGRDGRPGKSIRVQVQEHIRALHVAFAGLPSAPGAPSAYPFPAPSGGGSGALRDGATEPPAEPLPQPPEETPMEGAAEGATQGAREGDTEGGTEPPPEGDDQGGPEGPGEGGTEGANARRRRPADPRVAPTPTPTPTPFTTTPPPPYPPGNAGSEAEPHLSGGVGGEEIDPSHAAAVAIISGLPPGLRPGRGSAEPLIDAVAELVRLGWPAEDLGRCMTHDPPETIHNVAKFLIQRLPEPRPYVQERPPPPDRRTCPVHPYIELTTGGICRNCAAYARAAADDDLDQRPPVPIRVDRTQPADDDNEFRALYAASRRTLDALPDREDWLAAARKHLVETGEGLPTTYRTTVTAARLFAAATQPDPPPASEEE